MRHDLTDITLVIDKSSSMNSCRAEAEDGVNSFIREQQAQEGDTLLSIVEFSNVVSTTYTAQPIRDVPQYVLKPGGMTALLDAVGTAIDQTGERLAATPEADRPGLVIVAIITDGQENVSKSYARARIREMIEHQTGTYSWQFTFLGADQDAFKEAGALGIARAATANYSKSRSARAFQSASANVSRMRGRAKYKRAVVNTYTDAERTDMGGEPADKKEKLNVGAQVPLDKPSVKITFTP